MAINKNMLLYIIKVYCFLQLKYSNERNKLMKHRMCQKYIINFGMSIYSFIYYYYFTF